MTEVFFGVWSLPVVIAAAIAGLAFGFLVMGFALRTPLFSTVLVGSRRAAVLATLVAVVGGGFFFISQVAGSYYAGDPFWWRVASRYSAWIVFCLAIGLGVYLASRRDNQRRHRVALERARKEMDQ